MKLDNLAPGHKGLVTRILRGAEAGQRLHELGIVPGVKVEMLGRHPMRGPVIVKLDNTRIALGRRLAGSIEVEQSPD